MRLRVSIIVSRYHDEDITRMKCEWAITFFQKYLDGQQKAEYTNLCTDWSVYMGVHVNEQKEGFNL